MVKQVMKKYVEEHWWAFGLQAIVGIVFGLFALFSPQPTYHEWGVDQAMEQLPALATIVAVCLIILGAIEIIRTLIAIRSQNDWVLSLLIAVVMVGVGVATYHFRDAGYEVLTLMIGATLVVKGVFDIVIGFAVHDDSTDRVIWATAGIAGAVLGVMIVNYPNTGANQFIAVFGTYALIYGVAMLIYAGHSRVVKKELREKAEQKALAKKEAEKAKAKEEAKPKAKSAKTKKSTAKK